MKFKSKAKVIEAVQWLGGEPSDDLVLHCPYTSMAYTTESLTISTLEGPLNASPGDWIIKGIRGEFYPCKPDIFAMSYEPAE